MTDLKFTSPSGETTIKVEDTGRLGTVAPKTQLHIHKMTEIEELNKQTLTDLIHDWWADVFTTGSDWDGDTCIEDLVNQIELWLPTEHETNSYKWNECIRMIREKLR